MVFDTPRIIGRLKSKKKRRMITNSELKEIVERGTVTVAERKLIAEACKTLGVIAPSKTACKNCWVDAAMACWMKMRTEGKADGSKYALREGVDVIHNGVRVCAATFNDKMAEVLLKTGFPKSYIVCR